MNTKVRNSVECTECGKSLVRVVWNYGKNRPITMFFCNTSCKGQWQRKQRESLGFTKEWLIDQYQHKNRSANQIASDIGRDPKRVWEWMRDYGIETRPRGYDTSHLIKDGSAFRGKRHTEEFKQQQRERRLNDGRVPYLKNGVHWLKETGRKPASWKGGITPERQAFYASQKWKNAVKSVWKRADAKCECCGKDHRLIDNRKRDGFHIHHIDSFSIRARRAVVKNLLLVCRQCHHWIHSNENTSRKFLGKGH